MNSVPFIDLLMRNDEDEIRRYIESNGKKAKPVSPIYFFSDLSKDDFNKVQEEYGL